MTCLPKTSQWPLAETTAHLMRAAGLQALLRSSSLPLLRLEEEGSGSLRMLCAGLAAMRMDLRLAVLRASWAPLHCCSWRG